MSTVKRFLQSYFTPAGVQAARSLGGAVAFRLVGQAAKVVATLLVASSLPQAEVAILFFGLALLPYLRQAARVGGGQVLVREASAEAADVARVHGVWWAITIGGAITVTLAAMLLCFVTPVSPVERTAYLVLLGGLFASCFELEPHYQIKHRQAGHAGIVSLGDVALMLLLLALDRADEASLLSVAACYSLRSVMVAASQMACAGDAMPIPAPPPVASIWRAIQTGWRLTATALVFIAPMWLGMLIVRAMGDPEQTAVHGVAMQVVALFSLFSTTAATIVRPHVFGKHGLDRGFVLKLAAFWASYHGTLLLAAVTGVLVFAPRVLPDTVQAATAPIVLAVVYATVRSLGVPAQIYLFRGDCLQVFLPIAAGSTTVFLMLAIMLVGPYGSTGVWAAAAIGAACGVALRTAFAWRYYQSATAAGSPGRGPETKARSPFGGEE